LSAKELLYELAARVDVLEKEDDRQFAERVKALGSVFATLEEYLVHSEFPKSVQEVVKKHAAEVERTRKWAEEE
jgi:hypothetical protein